MHGSSPLILTTSVLTLAACTDGEPPVLSAAELEAARQIPYERQSPAMRNALARMQGYFPNIELIDRGGNRWRFYDELIRDRVVLINFFYTTCDGT